MNLKMGSQTFIDVQIPLLWGSRAVLQDQLGRLSVINLSGGASRLEIVGDKPAPGIEFLPSIDGYEILSKGKPIYRYDPEEKTLSSIDLGLPDCQVGRWQIRTAPDALATRGNSGCPDRQQKPNETLPQAQRDFIEKSKDCTIQ
jgi:hypothetical protein